MRAFSELAPGDLFRWQGNTWRKIHPRQNIELRYAPPHNAVKVTKPLATNGVEEADTYATVAGWLVMVEPSDLEEIVHAGTGPCRNGHVFTWTNNTTAGIVPPPQGLPCACGQMSYNAVAVQP